MRTLMYATTTIAIWQIIMTTIQTVSPTEKTEVAPLLTEQIEQLEKSLSKWEQALIVLIAVTAVAAVGIFIAEFGSRRVGKRLQDAKSALIEAKDKQLAAELKEKDLKIADVGKEAGDANKEAGRAIDNAKKTENANLLLRGEVAHLQQSAATQQERAATAEKNLETERIARLELQETMSLRALVVNGESIERLGQFKGTPFVLVVSTDAEAQYLANQIAFSLDRAEWKNMGILPSLDLAQGVEVRLAQRDRPIEADDPQRRIGAVLVEYLEANRIEAALRPATINVVGLSNGIVISIGMKPRPLLTQKAMDEAMPDWAKRMHNDERYKAQLERLEVNKKLEIEELRKKWKLPPYDKPQK